MSYDLMFQRAVELQNNGALNEAESIYLKLLEVMPQNSDIWNLLGLIAQAKGNDEQALNAFLSAITYAPTPFAPHFFNLGLTYRALRKYREALEALKKAVHLQPDFKEAWNFLGLTQEELEEHQEAIRSFCRALDIDNNYSEARANLCFYTKDKDTLFKLANEQPDDLQANLLAAASSDVISDKEKYLRQAVTHHPFHTSALLNLAKVCEITENFAEALQLYHKVLNLDENSVEAILGIADISLHTNDLDKAEFYYKKSFNLARDIAGAHLNYGILLYRQKRLAEALEQYRMAVQLDPEKPEISYNLALILKEVSEFEEALGLMFNAHQRCPEKKEFSVNIMETLSELYAQNAELALKIADNWQKIEPDNIFSKRIFAAISGITTSSDDDKNYAKQLFDAFAETYDDVITHLNPQIIDCFAQNYGELSGKILDLGCGTGLVAEKLKNNKTTFVGVDISEQMIEIAREKNLYQELICQDILSFLQESKNIKTFSLVLACDVFCYFGNLEDVLRLLNKSEVWFSVEAAEEDRNVDFYLSPMGRYKHKQSYVQKMLESIGFKEIQAFPLVLRYENGHPVEGFLFKAK